MICVLRIGDFVCVIEKLPLWLPQLPQVQRQNLNDFLFAGVSGPFYLHEVLLRMGPDLGRAASAHCLFDHAPVLAVNHYCLHKPIVLFVGPVAQNALCCVVAVV